MATESAATSSVQPTVGLVTWASEGNEGGPFHSRVLHVPTDASGLTIGRGYDMGSKLAATIVTDLTGAGVTEADAQTLAKASGLKGPEARAFIRDNQLESFEITPAVQKQLFAVTYAAEAAEAKRLCLKPDVVQKYGPVDWDAMDPAIQEMLVDMKYRGDYDGRARGLVQKHVVDNDLEAFTSAVCSSPNWPNVPRDRFDRRKAFLEAAVRSRKHPA